MTLARSDPGFPVRSGAAICLTDSWSSIESRRVLVNKSFRNGRLRQMDGISFFPAGFGVLPHWVDRTASKAIHGFRLLILVPLARISIDARTVVMPFPHGGNDAFNPGLTQKLFSRGHLHT